MYEMLFKSFLNSENCKTVTFESIDIKEIVLCGQILKCTTIVVTFSE